VIVIWLIRKSWISKYHFSFLSFHFLFRRV